MMPMTITITSVRRHENTVHARIHVRVPELAAEAAMTMRFVPPAGSSRKTWRELAYDRALQILDPA